MRSAALLIVCLCTTVASAYAGLKEYPFHVELAKSARALELVAHNDGPATITLHLTIHGENVASDVAWPVTRAVRPRSTVVVGRIFPEDPKKQTRIGYTTSIQFGDLRAVHAPVNYRLPYGEGSRYYITQAYGDPLTTHIGHASQYAVDFAMPAGTPVVAARAGVVIDLTLHYEAGGLYQDLKDKANHVAIEHDDGTVAHYSHLQKGNPGISIGQHVSAGSVIGYSGNTGYSSGPHLHFAVTKPEVLADGRVGHVSMPVKFYVDTAALPFEPRRGALVTASYTRDSQPQTPVRAADAPAHDALEAPAVSVIPVRASPAPAAGVPRATEEMVVAAVQAPPVPPGVHAAADTTPVQAAHAVRPGTAPVRAEGYAAAPLEQPAMRPAVEARAVAEWSTLELALAGLSAALVILFAAYFVRRPGQARTFTAE